MPMSRVNDFDFYRGNQDANLRLAVRYGATLPSPFEPNDWIIMYATATEEAMLAEVAAEIDQQGFSYYKLV